MSFGASTLGQRLLAKVLFTVIAVYLVLGAAALYWLNDVDSDRHSAD